MILLENNIVDNLTACIKNGKILDITEFVVMNLTTEHSKICF